MQLDIFNYECQTPYRVKKPIRLIELFAGKGAQAKALERKKANFVHWRICEFDKYAVATYNAIHGTNFVTSDITQITAADLGITDTDKYEYIMTYSFPCTDLSVAGKQAGMAKGSGTRSGLLWEVERLLKECKELPQVLLMENVPQVLNCDFGGWLEFLEGLGYHNYYQKLNAKDYGITQNRDRVFMVSILGDYYYEFPKPMTLQLRLKDMLEPTVDEKYYLSEKMIAGLKRAEQREHGPSYLDKATDVAKCVTTEVGNLGHYEQYIKEPVCNVVGNLNYYKNDQMNRVYMGDGVAPTIETMSGGGHETKIAEPTILQQPHGFNKGAELEHCPSITTSCWESNNLLKEPLIYDAYNKRQLLDGVVGTLTAHGNTSNTHCGTFFVSEPVCNVVANLNGTFESDVPYQAPSIIFHDKSYEPIYYSTNNDIEIYYIVVKDKHIGLIKDGEYWYAIRKLTPLECFRLMGFDDADFYKAKAAGISNSQLYKIAGNSIVVQVLEHIFEMILKEDKQ